MAEDQAALTPDGKAALTLAAAIDRLSAALERQPSNVAVASSPAPAPTAPALHPIAAAVAKLTTPRGIRNNNPGNVEKSPDKWQGEIDPGTDNRFMQFSSMTYGVRCAATVLHSYYARSGFRTVAQYIGRWAPPSENKTGTYAASVAVACGVKPNDLFPLDNAVNLERICRAIFRVENGGNYVLDTDIIAGVALVKL